MATATAAASKNTTAQAGKARAKLSELTTFIWVGTDKRGVKMKGEYQAKNPSFVRSELRRQGINPSTIKPKAKPLFGARGSRVKPRDIAVFSRMISVMMAAGVPMVQAFEIIASGQTNPRMKNMLTDIK